MNPSKKIRRLQSLLYTSGAGTILFSLWSGIRGIQIFFEKFRELRAAGDEILNQKYMGVFAGILMFILLFCVVGVYVYIGRKAMRASLGKKTGSRYILVAILVLINSVHSYVSDFLTLSLSEWIHKDGIMLSVIDFTSSVILAEVVVFSILLKKMR